MAVVKRLDAFSLLHVRGGVSEIQFIKFGIT